MKQLYWLAAAMMPLMLASCGSSSETAKGDAYKDVEYMPVKTESDGDWSMVAPNGEFLFEDGFDADARLTSVVDGVFVVMEKGKYAVYSADKNPKVIGDLEELKDAGAIGDGIIPVVRPQERISLYDKSGKLVSTLEPVSGKEITAVYARCTNDRLPFRTEDYKWGFLDSKGKVAIPATFDEVGTFGDYGYAVAYKMTDDKRQGVVINKKGETVLKLKEGQSAQSIFDDKVMVTDDEDRVSIVPLKGEAIKLPSKYNYVGDWNKDYIVVKSDNGWGVVRNNSEFDVVVKPRYEYALQILPDGKFLVEKDDDYLMLNAEGERVYTFDDVKNAFYVNSKWNIFVSEGKDQYFVDMEGQRVGNEYSELYGAISLSDVIESDYFNIDAFVSTIAEQVEADAISGFKLGSNTADYLAGEDPENYVYSYRLANDKVVEGYRFTVNSNFVSVGTLAQWEYNDPYSYYDYSRKYSWTNTPVESANLSATAQSPDLWKKVKPLIVKALEKKGFKVTDDYDSTVTMSNGTIILTINGSDSYGTTEVSINMSTEGVVVAEVAEAY